MDKCDVCDDTGIFIDLGKSGRVEACLICNRFANDYEAGEAAVKLLKQAREVVGEIARLGCRYNRNGAPVPYPTFDGSSYVDDGWSDLGTITLGMAATMRVEFPIDPFDNSDDEDSDDE